MFYVINPNLAGNISEYYPITRLELNLISDNNRSTSTKMCGSTIKGQLTQSGEFRRLYKEDELELVPED